MDFERRDNMSNLSVQIIKILTSVTSVSIFLHIDSNNILLGEDFRFRLSDFEEIFEGKISKSQVCGKIGNFLVKFDTSKKFSEFNDGILRTTINEEFQLFNMIYSLDNTEFIESPDEEIICYFEDDNTLSFEEQEEDTFRALLKTQNSDKIFLFIKQSHHKDDDDRKTNRFLHEAFFNYIRFSPEQIVELADIMDKGILSLYALNTPDSYLYEDLINISYYADAELFAKLVERTDINLYEDAETVCNVYDDLSGQDGAKAENYLLTAYQKGIRFSPEQILNIAPSLDNELLYRLVLKATKFFSIEQLKELEDWIEDDWFEKIYDYYKKSGIIEERKILKVTNEYSDDWFSISLSTKLLNFTSNSNELYVDVAFEYESAQGNILSNLEFYLTNIYGSIIKPTGYLTVYGSLPNKIDIRIDGKSHLLRFGPTFSLKADDPQIKDGLAFNISFEDMAKKYKVTKTYIL